MKISESFPSKYLKADDLHGSKVKVTIDRVDKVDVGTEEKPQVKPVVYFVGKDKGLVLNVTNATAMGEAYGDETDEWKGREINIYAQMVSFKGQQVRGLRVEIPVAVAADDDEPPF